MAGLSLPDICWVFRHQLIRVWSTEFCWGFNKKGGGLSVARARSEIFWDLNYNWSLNISEDKKVWLEMTDHPSSVKLFVDTGNCKLSRQKCQIKSSTAHQTKSFGCEASGWRMLDLYWSEAGNTLQRDGPRKAWLRSAWWSHRIQMTGSPPGNSVSWPGDTSPSPGGPPPQCSPRHDPLFPSHLLSPRDTSPTWRLFILPRDNEEIGFGKILHFQNHVGPSRNIDYI